VRLLIPILIGTALLLAVLGVAFRAVRRRAAERAAFRAWADTAPEQRADVMQSLSQGSPPNAVAFYLLGCARLRENRPRDAARAFGAAHHADCNLESAAILTFACLKAGVGEPRRFVELLVETWRETAALRRRLTRRDRALLATVAAAECPPMALSDVGRLIWSVGGAGHQRHVEAILANHQQIHSLRKDLTPNNTYV